MEQLAQPIRLAVIGRGRRERWQIDRTAQPPQMADKPPADRIETGRGINLPIARYRARAHQRQMRDAQGLVMADRGVDRRGVAKAQADQHRRHIAFAPDQAAFGVAGEIDRGDRAGGWRQRLFAERQAGRVGRGGGMGGAVAAEGLDPLDNRADLVGMARG